MEKYNTVSVFIIIYIGKASKVNQICPILCQVFFSMLCINWSSNSLSLVIATQVTRSFGMVSLDPQACQMQCLVNNKST